MDRPPSPAPCRSWSPPTATPSTGSTPATRSRSTARRSVPRSAPRPIAIPRNVHDQPVEPGHQPQHDRRQSAQSAELVPGGARAHDRSQSRRLNLDAGQARHADPEPGVRERHVERRRQRPEAAVPATSSPGSAAKTASTWRRSPSFRTDRRKPRIASILPGSARNGVHAGLAPLRVCRCRYST